MRYFGKIAGAFAAVALSAAGIGTAIAGHGKAGLWSIDISMSGMPQMPDMSKLPPEVRQQMKKYGVAMGGGGMTVQHCMTAEEVAMDTPPKNVSNKNCTTSNMKISSSMMSADLVCKGEFDGSGHMQFTYDSPIHYSGHVVVNGTADGHPIVHDTKFEGHWVSADCGGITH